MNKNFDIFGSSNETMIKKALTETKILGQKEDIFIKVLSAIDFRDCENDLAALRKFWYTIFPHFAEALSMNEALLEEQKITLRKYADVTDRVKMLEVENEAIKTLVGIHWENDLDKSVREKLQKARKATIR